MNIQEVRCDVEECKHKFKISDKNIKRHWLNKQKKIEETYFICPKCKHKYIINVTDEEIRQTIDDCKVIDKEIRKLSNAVTNLLKSRNSILNRAKQKSLELEKQWTQKS